MPRPAPRYRLLSGIEMQVSVENVGLLCENVLERVSIMLKV